MKSGQPYWIRSLGTLLFLLTLTAAVGAYQGRHGALDSGGGVMVGDGMRTAGVVGVHTSGASASATQTHQEGFLAFFGQPFLITDAASLAFGVVAVGSDQALSLSVTNYGGVSLLFSGFSFASGGESVFALEGAGETETLSPRAAGQ